MDQHRCGKIARLPREIRHQLNHQLADNVSGRRILTWLNALPAVRKILTRDFASQPINKQNLSAWREGGFRDWDRAQEVRRRARISLEEAQEIRSEVKESNPQSTLLDRVGDRMALALWELFREAEQSSASTERTRAMLEIAHELTHLRRSDYQCRKESVPVEQWEYHQKRWYNTTPNDPADGEG